jgi:hypothetical protein
LFPKGSCVGGLVPTVAMWDVVPQWEVARLLRVLPSEGIKVVLLGTLNMFLWEHAVIRATLTLESLCLPVCPVFPLGNSPELSSCWRHALEPPELWVK